MFQEWLLRAQARLSASVVFTDPVVISSDIMKDNRPVNLKGGRWLVCMKGRCKRGRDADIVATLHAGFHYRLISFIFREGRQKHLRKLGGSPTLRNRSSYQVRTVQKV